MKLHLQPCVYALLTAAGIAFSVYRWTRPADVSVFRLKPRLVVQALSVVGRVRPEQKITLHTETGGRLQKLFVREGDFVHSGQPLALVESAEAEALLAQAIADLAQRHAELKVNSTTRDGQLRESVRLRQLASSQSIATADLDRAETALQNEDARLKVAEAAVQAAQANVSATTARLRRHTLTSPIDGVVLDCKVDEGQTLAAYEAVFALGGTAKLEIEAEADEAYAGALRPGQAATLRASGVEKQFPASVKEVLPSINPATGARRLILSAPANEPDLVPGRTVEVTVVIERRDAALSLPRTALVDAARDPAVFIVQDGVVARRAVRFRDWPAADVLVTQGLAADSLVVRDPTQTTLGARVIALIADENPAASEPSRKP